MDTIDSGDMPVKKSPPGYKMSPAQLRDVRRWRYEAVLTSCDMSSVTFDLFNSVIVLTPVLPVEAIVVAKAELITLISETLEKYLRYNSVGEIAGRPQSPQGLERINGLQENLFEIMGLSELQCMCLVEAVQNFYGARVSRRTVAFRRLCFEQMRQGGSLPALSQLARESVLGLERTARSRLAPTRRHRPSLTAKLIWLRDTIMGRSQ